MSFLNSCFAYCVFRSVERMNFATEDINQLHCVIQYLRKSISESTDLAEFAISSTHSTGNILLLSNFDRLCRAHHHLTVHNPITKTGKFMKHIQDSITDIREAVEIFSPLVFRHCDYYGLNKDVEEPEGIREALGKEIWYEMVKNTSQLIELLVDQVNGIFTCSEPHQKIQTYRFSVLLLKAGALSLKRNEQQLRDDRVWEDSFEDLTAATHEKSHMITPHTRQRLVETSSFFSSSEYEQQDQIVDWSSNINLFVNMLRNQRVGIVFANHAHRAVLADFNSRIISVDESATRYDALSVLSELIKVQYAQEIGESRSNARECRFFFRCFAQARKLLVRKLKISHESTFTLVTFTLVPSLVYFFLRMLCVSTLQAWFFATVIAIVFSLPLVQVSKTTRQLPLSWHYSPLPPDYLPRKSQVSGIVDSILKQSTLKKSCPALILHGPAGAGKSILGALTIRNARIRKVFNSSAWISLGCQNLTFCRLYACYAAMIEQLIGPALHNDFFLSLLDNCFIEEMAMDFLKHEVEHLLHQSNLEHLIVLDNVCTPLDVKWFRFSSLRHCYLLITTQSLSFFQESSCSEDVILEAGPLSEDEAVTILSRPCINRVLPFDTSRNIGVTFSTSPFLLNLIGQILEDQSNDDSSNIPEALKCQSFSISEKMFVDGEVDFSSLDSGNSQDVVCQIFESALFRLCQEASDVVKLCLVAFASVFQNDSEESSFPLLEPFIPSCIASLLWESIIDSSELSNRQIVSIESAISRRPMVPSSARLFTRSGFIREKLVALGVIKVHPETCGLTLSCSRNLLSSIYSATKSIDTMHASWNNSLVKGYRKATKLGFQDELDIQYFSRWLPLHLFRAGMHNEVAGELERKDFVNSRYKTLRPIVATIRHISDFKMIFTQAAPTCSTSMISAFERISELLLENQENNYSAESAIENGSCMLSLAFALKKFNFRNESVVFFLESKLLLSISLSFDAKHCVLIQKLLSLCCIGLGSVFEKREEYNESLKYYNEGLHLSKLADESSYLSSEVLYSIGSVHSSADRFDEARETFREAILQRKTLHGLFHPYVVNILEDLSALHVKAQCFDKAFRIFSFVLHLKKHIFGNESKHVAKTLVEMGDVYAKVGKGDLAIKCYVRAVVIQKKVLDQSHADRGVALFKLGNALRKHGTLDDALAAYKKALSLQRGIYPDLAAQTLHSLGDLFFQMDCLDDSLQAYKEALQTRISLFGSRHQAVAKTLHCIGMVNKQIGDLESAYEAFSDAIWASSLNSNIETPTPDKIMKRSIALFGEKASAMPLLSCRLFACASLLIDQTLHEREGKEMHVVSLLWKQLKHVLPLLKSYVNAEIIALGDDTDDSQNENRRRVVFSTFDFSSVKTPVDMITSSNSQIELSINALETILDEVIALVKKGRKEGTFIAKILLALDSIASIDGNSKRIALAETMPALKYCGPSWPPSRFVQAATMYRDELESVLAEVEASKDHQAYFTTTTKQCLSFHIFSNIRFHLRRLLDVPPTGFTVHHDSKSSKDYAKCRSQTYKLVGMSQPEHGKAKYCRDSKLWETSISYVFNLALRYIYRYFLYTETKAGINTQDAFSVPLGKQLKLSMLGQDLFSTLDNSLGHIDHDLNEIVADIQGARLLFGTLGASRFVLELLDWPGVKDAIDDAGGWAPIEKMACLLRRHGLAVYNAELEHFELLVDVSELKRRLDSVLHEIQSSHDTAQTFLEGIWSQLKRCKYRGIDFL